MVSNEMRQGFRYTASWVRGALVVSESSYVLAGSATNAIDWLRDNVYYDAINVEINIHSKHGLEDLKNMYGEDLEGIPDSVVE